jgi:pilus assembly protein CpaC
MGETTGETPLIRTTLLVALTAALALAAAGPARATEQDQQLIRVAASDAGSRFVPLGVGKSVVLDLPRDVKEVLIADPGIANVVLRSSRRAYMIGSKVGQTNVFFFDHNGQQIVGIDLAVTRDLNGIRAALRQALPQADIRVEGIGEDGIMLTGTVATAAESQLAYNVASQLVRKLNGTTTNVSATGGVATSSTTSGGNGSGVINGLTIRSADQVMLKVTVAEMQRDVLKQLGVDLSGSMGVGTSVINFNTDNPFTVQGNPLSSTAITPSFGARSPLGTTLDPSGTLNSRFGATIRAMERAGVIRTLAEPNLTAISGENATFLAGGEFPVISSISCTGNVCTPTVEFKKFGVSLTFTPVVLSEGRISLKVMAEVSELSTEGAIQQSGFTIPSLKTRRADSTVEIPSGGSLAMAGMIQEQTKQHINGLPGLLQLPVLGQLFRSRDFNNRQTELVVIVTPYVVRAVSRRNLSRPDDGFADPSDPATYLLGRLNRIYGVAKPNGPVKGQVVQHGAYRGKYGFILD